MIIDGLLQDIRMSEFGMSLLYFTLFFHIYI